MCVWYNPGAMYSSAINQNYQFAYLCSSCTKNNPGWFRWKINFKFLSSSLGTSRQALHFYSSPSQPQQKFYILMNVHHMARDIHTIVLPTYACASNKTNALLRSKYRKWFFFRAAAQVLFQSHCGERNDLHWFCLISTPSKHGSRGNGEWLKCLIVICPICNVTAIAGSTQFKCVF